MDKIMKVKIKNSITSLVLVYNFQVCGDAFQAILHNALTSLVLKGGENPKSQKEEFI